MKRMYQNCNVMFQSPCFEEWIKVWSIWFGSYNILCCLCNSLDNNPKNQFNNTSSLLVRSFLSCLYIICFVCWISLTRLDILDQRKNLNICEGLFEDVLNDCDSMHHTLYSVLYHLVYIFTIQSSVAVFSYHMSFSYLDHFAVWTLVHITPKSAHEGWF